MGDPRPIVSVHVSVAGFARFVLKAVAAGGKEGLADQVLALTDCLVDNDPGRSEYGASLLTEAAAFRDEKARKARASAMTRYQKAGHATASDRKRQHATASDGMQNPATDQSRSDHKDSFSPPSSERGHHGGRDSESTPRPAAGRKPRTPRPPDHLWDSLCDAFGLNPVSKTEQARIGKVVACLREKEATPEKVRLVYSEMERQGWSPFTPEGLVKWYDQLSTPKPAAAAAPTYVPGFR
jgi:hypothetical protein